ncbi:MAG: cobalamin biosynthesis protein CbiG [Methanosphaera stadtmanae]|nr:cobalamin biosynthesis protein CbiG [Methanosphaera stadtmanae]
MKYAIISITKQGKILSDTIYNELTNNPMIMQVTQYHKNVKDAIKNTFEEYDCIIGIMASGIMIRSIAPYVNSKLSDPAIILIDDNGNHVISLLSGHFGGANEITHKIASLINADPVITTSTDINNKIGIDSIAKHYYCKLENPKNIKYINRALVDNKKANLSLPSKYDYILNDEIKKSYNVKIDNSLNYISSEFNGHTVNLIPKKLVMGIGARRDISSQKVFNAISSTCNIMEIPIKRIDYFATASVKSEEKGILDNVNKLGKELKIIPIETIKSFQNNEISTSSFVMKQFGIKGVCEPCSLLANDNDSILIFKKTAYDGVTIAVSSSN